MLRTRAEKGRIVHSSESNSCSGESGHRVFGDGEYSRSNKVGRTDAGGGSRARDCGQDVAGVADIGMAAEEVGLNGLVAVLVGMKSEGVFRMIIGFL